MYYDSHCHIYSEYYSDIDSLINDLANNDVKLLINNGCDMNSNKEVMSYIGKYPIMYGALGIHPENVNSYTNNDLLYIESNLANSKILAIGEIGLDYHYSKDDREKQISLFEAQLAMAERNNIPVIVHSREATKDTIDTLNKYNVRGIIHSFSGSYETAMIYIKKGFFLGINGVITFKNSNLKDTIKKIGPEYITIETDSPYLTPHPFRGEKNSPKNVKIIVKYLADLFEISEEKMAKIVRDNLDKIFDI